MGEAAHSHHAHHAGGALHRVRLPEDSIDCSLVIGRGLESKQPCGDTLQVALGLLDKQRAELVF